MHRALNRRNAQNPDGWLPVGVLCVLFDVLDTPECDDGIVPAESE